MCQHQQQCAWQCWTDCSTPSLSPLLLALRGWTCGPLEPHLLLTEWWLHWAGADCCWGRVFSSRKPKTRSRVFASGQIGSRVFHLILLTACQCLAAVLYHRAESLLVGAQGRRQKFSVPLYRQSPVSSSLRVAAVSVLFQAGALQTLQLERNRAITSAC